MDVVGKHTSILSVSALFRKGDLLTPVAGGLVTVGTKIRGPGPVNGVCYGINGGLMKNYLVGDKPSCAGDDDTKSWSTASFVAILVSPIRHGELMISMGLFVQFDRIGCLGLLV